MLATGSCEYNSGWLVAVGPGSIGLKMIRKLQREGWEFRMFVNYCLLMILTVDVPS